MTREPTSVQVPHVLYERLERLAAVSGQSLADVVTRTLATSLPVIPEGLSPASREALRVLEQESDVVIWRTVAETMDDTRVERFTTLREQQRAGTLSERDRQELAALRDARDLLILRKAYAAVVLKWRGHRVPAPVDVRA